MVVPGIRLWDKEFGDFGKLPILTINCTRTEKLPGRLAGSHWMDVPCELFEMGMYIGS